MEEQLNLPQWYTRRAGVTRGPFTAESITRYILLGRISLEDELSKDRISWSVAGQLTSLLPEQLLNLNSWDDYRELIVAQLQADERQGERRCRDCKNRGNCRERRTLADRRQPSTSVAVTFQHPDKPVPVRKTRHTQLGALLLVLLVAGAMLAWLVPSQR